MDWNEPRWRPTPGCPDLPSSASRGEFLLKRPSSPVAVREEHHLPGSPCGNCYRSLRRFSTTCRSIGLPSRPPRPSGRFLRGHVFSSRYLVGRTRHGLRSWALVPDRSDDAIHRRAGGPDPPWHNFAGDAVSLHRLDQPDSRRSKYPWGTSNFFAHALLTSMLMPPRGSTAGAPAFRRRSLTPRVRRHSPVEPWPWPWPLNRFATQVFPPDPDGPVDLCREGWQDQIPTGSAAPVSGAAAVVGHPPEAGNSGLDERAGSGAAVGPHSCCALFSRSCSRSAFGRNALRPRRRRLWPMMVGAFSSACGRWSVRFFQNRGGRRPSSTTCPPEDLGTIRSGASKAELSFGPGPRQNGGRAGFGFSRGLVLPPGPRPRQERPECGGAVHRRPSCFAAGFCWRRPAPEERGSRPTMTRDRITSSTTAWPNLRACKKRFGAVGF